MTYEWAANQYKLERALKELEASGKKFSEDDVKKLYIKYGGLVLVELKKKGRPSSWVRE